MTYTFSHFCVDFSCFYFLYSGFGAGVTSTNTAGESSVLQVISLGFLLYNIIAFGLQPIIGFFCDSHTRLPIAIIGCVLVFIGLALNISWVSLILCALGNACFHIGGGIDGLTFANGNMRRSGVFVSSGALGVSMGTLSGQHNTSPIFPIFLMAFSIILISCISQKHTYTDKALNFNSVNLKLGLSSILVLLFLSVTVRSYVGFTVPIEWKTTTLLFLLPSIASCLGKFSGGFLADILGAKRTGVLSLMISIPFLCFGYAQPVLCFIGITLFNITMPITLCAVATKLPYNPGLSFGLTTLALLCGNVPVFFFALPTAIVPIVIMISILFSALCIFASTINQKRSNHIEKENQSINTHAV